MKLPTDYTDAKWKGNKIYDYIQDKDTPQEKIGKIELKDATEYMNKEKSFFGAKDANAMNEALNLIMEALQKDNKDLYKAFHDYFENQKKNFEKKVNKFEEGQEYKFNEWFKTIQNTLNEDSAGNLLNQIKDNKSEFDGFKEEMSDFKGIETKKMNTLYHGAEGNAALNGKAFCIKTTALDDPKFTGHITWGCLEQAIYPFGSNLAIQGGAPNNESGIMFTFRLPYGNEGFTRYARFIIAANGKNYTMVQQCPINDKRKLEIQIDWLECDSHLDQFHLAYIKERERQREEIHSKLSEKE